MSDVRFYVASADTGTVTVYAVEDAGLRVQDVVEVGPDATALALSGDRIYAAVRTVPAIATLAVDRGTGGVRPVATTPVETELVYLSVSPDRRRVFGASYSDGAVESVAVDADGVVLAGSSDVFAIGPNAHSILPAADGASVWVAVLGTDLVRRVPLDADGRFVPDHTVDVALPDGFGPRHLAYEPSGDLLVFGERTGGLARISVREHHVSARWSTVSPELGMAPGVIRGPGNEPETDAAGRPLIWAADLAVSPDGRFVWSTERRKSVIMQSDAATGTVLATTPTEQQPRGIGLDPTGRYLLATGERSSTVTLYTVDSSSGALDAVAQAPVGAGALWVESLVIDG